MSLTAGLPDPRKPEKANDNPLIMAEPAPDDAWLQERLRAALNAGDDVLIRRALHGGMPQQLRRVWQALAEVLDAGDDSVGLRFFAIPLVIVVGARAQLLLQGVVPDIGKVTGLLEQHGAIGATRNFGLGNALCGIATLDALSPAALWRAAKNPSEYGLMDALAPEPVAAGPGREQVHLRFMVGAGVTPQHLPSFLESASNIGTWGMPLTQELARQLAQPGLEILPMPRPPQPLVKAAYAGRRAQLEAALSLFLGNTVRQFRMSVGDPDAVLSAHQLEGGAGELRLSLSSPFDESLFEGFCWPLHPLDETGEVTQVFQQALSDCRVSSVRMIAEVMPDRLEGGSSFIGQHALKVLAPIQH